MRQILKKLFRYKLVSIYFILSQLVILVAIFGVLRIFNKAYAKEKDRLEAIAENRIEMNITTFAEEDILSCVSENVNAGNILAEGQLSVEVAELNSKNRCEILLSVNEDLPYKMISGHIPGTTPDDYGKNCVALGRNKYKSAYERGGEKFITINQEEYEVVGVIGSEVSDYWDYKIVLNINCISDGLKRTLKNMNELTISIYSNEQEMKSTYNQVYSNIINKDSTCIISSYQKKQMGESTVNSTLEKENYKTNVMVYMFCLINSIIISIFWVIQRRREFAIRRIFGFSNIKLIVTIGTELLALMGTSLIIYIICYAIYHCISFAITGNVELWSISSCVSVIILFLITLIVSMVYPVVYVYKKTTEIIR